MKDRACLTVAAAFLLSGVARGAETGRPPPAGEGVAALRQLNGALSQVAERVTPAVVQVQVSGYGAAAGDESHAAAAFIVRQRGIGSGVIVDPAGYIVTNAHVVQGAQRVVVLLPAATIGRNAMRKRVYPATIVGTHRDSDVAVLKIEATGL